MNHLDSLHDQTLDRERMKKSSLSRSNLHGRWKIAICSWNHRWQFHCDSIFFISLCTRISSLGWFFIVHSLCEWKCNDFKGVEWQEKSIFLRFPLLKIGHNFLDRKRLYCTRNQLFTSIRCHTFVSISHNVSCVPIDPLFLELLFVFIPLKQFQANCRSCKSVSRIDIN